MRAFLQGCVTEPDIFKDGQPHVAFSAGQLPSYLIVRLDSCEAVVKLAMAVEVMRRHQVEPEVYITYLLGARMDRAIGEYEPYTLKAIAGLINSLRLTKPIKIFCPHSQASTDLIHNSVSWSNMEEAFYDKACVRFVRDFASDLTNVPDAGLLRRADISIVFPDEGAKKRIGKMNLLKAWPVSPIVVLSKDRDERTGKVLGTKLISGQVNTRCLILDDLCDGGATFAAAANVLREHGAEKVGLAVCHGVFSRGLPIAGIDHVYTSSSYADLTDGPGLTVVTKFGDAK